MDCKFQDVGLLICLICGQLVGKEFPIPIKELQFTPLVPHIPGLTENKLGMTVFTDRLCCQACYRKIKDNDQKIIEEAGQIRNPEAKRRR